MIKDLLNSKLKNTYVDINTLDQGFQNNYENGRPSIRFRKIHKVKYNPKERAKTVMKRTKQSIEKFIESHKRIECPPPSSFADLKHLIHKVSESKLPKLLSHVELHNRNEITQRIMNPTPSRL